MNQPDFLQSFAALVAEAMRPIIREELQHLNGKGLLADYPDMMTRDQVARVLQVSKRHIMTLEKRGKLPKGVIVGNKAIYPKDTIEKYLTKQR